MALTPRICQTHGGQLHTRYVAGSLAHFAADRTLIGPYHFSSLTFQALVLLDVPVLELEVVSCRLSYGGIPFRRQTVKACEVKSAVVPCERVGTGVFESNLFGLGVGQTRERHVAESHPFGV